MDSGVTNTNYSDIKYTIFSTLFLCPRPQRRPHTPHATDEQKIGHSASQASKGQLTKIRDTIRAFVPTMQSARNKGATALNSLKNMKDAIVVKANENSTWLSIFTSLVTTAYVLHTILPMIILAFVVLAVVFYDHRSTRLTELLLNLKKIIKLFVIISYSTCVLNTITNPKRTRYINHLHAHNATLWSPIPSTISFVSLDLFPLNINLVSSTF